MDEGWGCREAEVGEDPGDDGGLGDVSDEPHAALAGGAKEHINAKDAHHQRGP